jgi:hypothetical protein
MNNSNVIKSLTYLGAVPFFLAFYISLTSNSFLGVDAAQWFLSYGLVILSFMAGTLWGQVVSEEVSVKRIALATNAITLAAWFSFLLAGPPLTLIITALGFIALYLLEALAMAHLKRPDYYLGLRLKVTALVVIAHGLMFWQV